LISLLKGNYRGLNFDRRFAQGMRYWTTGTVETLYFAMEILQRLGLRDALTMRKEEIREFLDHCYDRTSHLYRPNPVASYTTLQSTHCALGVLKCMRGVSPKQPLGVEVGKELLGDETGRMLDSV